MGWQTSTLWWLAGGALVALEMLSGSFYLLMLSLGAVAAALAAHAGLGLSAQLLSAAAVGGSAVLLWHWRRERPGAHSDAAHNPDINLDIGSPVQVDDWQADGHTRVRYRGSSWDARWSGSGSPTPGAHVVCAVQGNCLLLERAHG